MCSVGLLSESSSRWQGPWVWDMSLLSCCFLVSAAVVRIGQERFETTAGAAHQACEESGGKRLQQCPSREGAWGGLGLAARAVRRGIQHGPRAALWHGMTGH